MPRPGWRDEFERQGYVHLPGVFDRATVDALADRVWSHREVHRGTRRDDPKSWDVPGPWVGLKALKKEALFQSLHSAALCEVTPPIPGSRS